jgi:hypothetical protein
VTPVIPGVRRLREGAPRGGERQQQEVRGLPAEAPKLWSGGKARWCEVRAPRGCAKGPGRRRLEYAMW